MKPMMWKCVTAAFVSAGIATGALASGECGMNTNKPCPQPDKLGSKEPAYKSMNENKPQTTGAPTADAKKDVKAAPAKAAADKAPAKAAPPEKAAPAKAAPPEKAAPAKAAPPEKAAEKAPAKTTPAKTAPAEVKSAGGDKAQGKSLSGVSGSDLKVQPQDPKTQQKEPAK